jgi:hypothetical protein
MSKLPDKTKAKSAPTANSVREALSGSELYLHIQAVRQVRKRYGCTQLQATMAVNAAIQSGVLIAKSCIGLQEDTPAYGLS